MRPSPRQVDEPAERLVRLGSADVKYLLRRSTRSRGIRATIDPRRGLVVSVPATRRTGWRDPERAADAFLLERGPWVLRHLARLERERAAARTRGDDGLIHYRGELHRVRVREARTESGAGRGSVERVGDDTGDELVIRLGEGQHRPPRQLLVEWLRERAAEAIGEAVGRYGQALGVRPSKVDLRDPRTRWGSASRSGRLMFSWRLVLAPPGSLETVVVHELAHLRFFGHGPRFWALVASLRPSHLADRSWLRRHSHALHSGLDPTFEAVEQGPA